MINEKHFFVGGINADDSTRLIDQTQYLNLENLREGVSEFGHAGELNNIPSTSILFDDLPSGTNKTIGRISDYGTNRTIFHNVNSLGEHGIYAYDYSARTTYTVLLSSQTASGLNYSTTFRIARNTRVAGQLLIYTDGNNEPQCVDIEAGIKLNHPSYVTYTQAYGTPIPYETLTLIKRPPIFRPQATKSTDGGFTNNYIENNAYQFTFRYQYKNGQFSALSTFSQLMGYNGEGSTLNYINIQMSFSETIPDYVQQIDFCVRYGNFGKTFIIRSYNKSYTYDLLAIQSHNAGSVQLGFAFYDNVAGIALDETTANTSFHVVPLQSKTVEQAKSRVFLGNNKSGYDTPKITSLTTSLTTTDTNADGSYGGTWGYITLNANLGAGGCQDTFMFPFIHSLTSPSPFYYASVVRNSTIWNGGYGSVPSTINLSDCIGFASEAALVDYLKNTQYPFVTGGCPVGTPHWQAGYTISAYDALGSTTIINYVSTSVNQFFKSNSTYYVTIAFYDRFRRKCGVLRDYSTMVIPQRTYDQTTFNAAIQWLLNNNNTLEEIPSWAYYYQIHITRNTTTRFFEQIGVNDSTYVLKNQDGTYTYGNSTYDVDTYAIGFDISLLTGVGLGYTFNEGDFAVIYLDATTNYTLRVIGQDGNFVLLEPRDIGTLDDTTNAIIELYTPYKPSITEPFYETGEVMLISDPATDERAYSVLSGTINGDCYAVERELPDTTLYIVEAMSPNDSVWFIWQTDTGWVNFIDDIGQTTKTDEITWSDTWIRGTKINGLNVFQPLNRKTIGGSSGEIQKLQLTNKQTEQGTVILIVTSSDHLSAYLSEVQLVAAAKNDASPIQSTEVIGTINALKNGFGTTNPESVIEYNGVVFGISVLYGVVWQYAQDGVTAISDYKMKSFFDRFSKRYIELGTEAIETLCGFSYIESCVDVSTKELLLMLPQTETVLPPDILFGFNGNMASSARPLSNADVLEAIGELGAFNIYRYPGGNVANSFNWETGKDDDNTGNANTLEDVAALVEAQGCDVIFVLNMLTKTLANQLQMLAAANALGIPIKYFELGNEFNNVNNPGHTTFPLPQNYADEAEIWRDAIQAVYPDAVDIWIGGDRNWAGGEDWNSRVLAKNPGSITWHVSPNIDVFYSNGVIDYPAILADMVADWEDSGMDLVTSVPISATEFNYTYDDGNVMPLADQAAVTLYMLQQVPNFIGINDGTKLMCVRGIEGLKQGAIYVQNNAITFMPTSVAVAQFLSQGNLVLPSYNNEIPDYTTSIQNRFSFYDGQPKILAYKFEANKWNGAYLWLPDCQDYIGNRLVGFKNGAMWLHNENNGSFNVIYDTQYPQRVCLTANLNPSVIRDVLSLAIEGNFIPPNYTVVYSESPYIQITDLVDTDWTNQESVLYAPVFRDRLSPNSTGTADEKLYTGDVVKSAYPMIMIEWSEYDSQLIINFVNTLYSISRGHNTILRNQKTNRNAT